MSSGNNATGVSTHVVHLTAKRLELLKEIAPRTRKVFALVSAHEVISRLAAKQLEEAAAKMGVKVVSREVSSNEDMEKILLQSWSAESDAVFYLPSVFVSKYIDRVVNKTLKEQMPLSVYEETLLRAGALFSYGGDFKTFGVQAARLVAKVLRGEKPSNIPVETPEKLVLAINRATAKLLGSKISREAMANADRFVD